MNRVTAAPLKWVERGLLAAGVVLGLWALFLIGEHWYYSRIPVPDAPAALELPGEDEEEADAPVATAGRIERGAWVARLTAPSVGLSATVLEGSDDRTLRRAAGHIEYTPLPGEGGNAGIAGHRDTTFYPVRNLEVGDSVTVTTAGAVLEYKVSETMIVEPEDVYVLEPTPAPALTLVTCYPFNFVGSAPKRFIVRADLVAEKPR
jgi:sortase A